MDTRQAIPYGITGTEVEIYPPEALEGVPSAAATYSVWAGGAGNDQDAEFSGTTTMDTTSLALDGSAGPSQTNRRHVPLAATTGIVLGRWYVMENAEGQREFVKVVKLASADYVEVEHELVHEYITTSSYLKGYRQVFTVDATWVAAIANLNDPEFPYRVSWSYTIASKARLRWTYLDLVRKAKGHGVTERDILTRHPDMKYQEPRSERGTGWADYIEAGWRRVQMDLRQTDLEPNELAEGQLLDELVIAAALLVTAEDGIVPPGRDIEAVVRERFAAYRRDFERMTLAAKPKLLMAQGTSGAITDNPFRKMAFDS
jgi:hypothetical protein